MPTPPHRLPRIIRPAIAAAALSLTAILGLITLAPSSARASTRQIAIIQDQNMLAADPTGALAQMQALGATTVRVLIDWDAIAPAIQSTHKPRFNATDPAAYPAANWDFYDEVVRLAEDDGMTVDLTLTGGAPRWAATCPSGSSGPGLHHLPQRRCPLLRLEAQQHRVRAVRAGRR